MKIYLKKPPQYIQAEHRRQAGKKVMLGLRQYKRLIDAVFIYPGGESKTPSANGISCRVFIQTVHGGMLMMTSTGSNFYSSVMGAIRKSRRTLHDIVDRCPELIDSFGPPRYSLLPHCVEVNDYSRRVDRQKSQR